MNTVMAIACSDVCCRQLRGANGSRECVPDDGAKRRSNSFFSEEWIASLRSQ
jgi:hypothetical protein